MKDNLFVNLQKYKKSKSNPKENFFTEIFSYLLNNNKKLGKKILEKLFKVEVHITDYIVQTQVHRGDKGQTDMEILINGTELLIVEIKINSSQGLGQLKKYKELSDTLNKEGDISSQVFYLTRRYEELSEKDKKLIKKHIYWYEIYDIISNYEENGILETFLIQEFIGLMENEEMKPFRQLKINDLNGYHSVKNNIILLLEQVEHRIHDKYGNFGKSKLNTSVRYFEKTSIYYFNRIHMQIGLLIDENGLNLYIYRNKLNQKIENKINRKNFKEDKWYFYIELLFDEAFFSKNSEEQLTQLTNFCTNELDDLLS